MKNLVYRLNQTEISNLMVKLKSYLVINKVNYVQATYHVLDTKIYIYESNKIVLQGNDVAVVAKQFFSNFTPINKPDSEKTEIVYYNLKNFDTIGSDEVGVGDFFGGLIVCAAYLKKENLAAVRDLGVKDSKKLTDAKMLSIYPELIKLVDYEICHLSPNRYNLMYDQYQNSHILKTYLHHQAISALIKRVNPPYKVIMDQYASKQNYMKYLKVLNLPETPIDFFAPKAESHYDVVACASIIARVEWINQMTKLSKKIEITLPYGASDQKVAIAAHAILDKFGVTFLKKIAKHHFKTMDEIIKDKN